MDPAAALSGVCFAGLFMVIESWLNERATSANRGQVLAVYMVINLTAVTAGQMLLPLGRPGGLRAVRGDRDRDHAGAGAGRPDHLERAAAAARGAPRLGRLYAMSPVGVVGGFFVGLANGAFGGLGVVFAEEVGLSITGIALFMSAALVGGALAQLPLGRFSDRTDRRKVIIAVGLLAALMGGRAGAARRGAPERRGARHRGRPRRRAAVALIAAADAVRRRDLFACTRCASPTPTTSSAREEFVEASSGLLLTWAIGASIGPVLGGLRSIWSAPPGCSCIPRSRTPASRCSRSIG